MNFIDIIFAAALGWGIFRGFSNGVIRELAGLLGVIIGVWLGLRLAFVFAEYYRTNWEVPEKFVPFIAFFTAFALGLLAVFLLGRILSKMLEAVALGWANKTAGAVFGGLKWAFISGSLITLVGNAGVIPESTKEDSATYPFINAYCITVNEYSVGLIPAAKNVFADLDTYFTKIDSAQGNIDSTGANLPVRRDSTGQAPPTQP